MITPQEVVAAALARAHGTDLAVIASTTSQVNLRWAGNSLTTNGHVESMQIDVVAMDPDGGSATVSGQVADLAAASALVERARAAAAAAEPDDDRRELPRSGVSDDWDAAPGRTGADALARLATGLGASFAAANGVEHFGYAEQDCTTTYLGTTAGTLRRHVQFESRAEFTAKDRTRTRSAWAGFADLDIDVPLIAAGLAEDLDRQQRVIDVRPGHQTVILSPSATADLMIDLYWSADARAALEGRSVFAAADGSTRIGEDLGGGVTLSSDPADPDLPCGDFEVARTSSDTSSTYDNGLRLQRTEWIADGRLQHLVSTRHSASALGHGPATPGIGNLRLSTPSGHGSVADLIARTEAGLLITCLWYNRVVDPRTLLLTGLTRDGVYVVRDGRIVGATGNFRFNESPVSLLGRIVDSSSEERTLAREMGDYFNRAQMPALTVEDFNLSTASEAH